MLPDGNGSLEPLPTYAWVDRFYLSAHVDRGGLLSMIARYHPSKVILTHGAVRAQTNMASHLDTKQNVSLPQAGEVVGYRTLGNDPAR